MKNASKTFWITNISDRNVTLGDLNVSIKSFTSADLLDNKHYPHLTLEMLEKSETNGSLFRKSNMVVHRKVPPTLPKKTQILMTNDAIPSREHSILQIKQENYEELNITDEQYLANQEPNDPAKPITIKKI
jgi:hypothetical protein